MKNITIGVIGARSLLATRAIAEAASAGRRVDLRERYTVLSRQIESFKPAHDQT